MSRAFVKETDGDDADDLPPRPQSPHVNYVTPAGFRLLQQRLRELATRKSLLSGSDDMADRQQLKRVERDLRFYEERLERAVLVRPETQPDDKVHFGATVAVRDRAGAVETFAIVGEDEADAAQGKISWVSPLAAALMDAEVGDEVCWKRPMGDKELEVLTISKDGGVC
ncbi:GreA/GreB family elongation factor [Methylogaea oryzae]|uniref:Transcription elongation factor n=1 Tax=Methylogaea oryzae TaxID=1295382 RepID=A0A8D4VLX3_9GAMM|nr:GreA/GreB family elongation factor [Methylogaea oryzae]BBL69542.1 transcription elongation factor [Methylogaea oryzae]